MHIKLHGKRVCEVFGHELNEKFHFLSLVRDDEFELERRVLVVVECYLDFCEWQWCRCARETKRV